jgi:hypothetical protein
MRKKTGIKKHPPKTRWISGDVSVAGFGLKTDIQIPASREKASPA